MNGAWVGVHVDPEEVVEQLRKCRRSQLDMLRSEISVFRDIKDREIHVYSDSGRMTRPLLIVENARNSQMEEEYDMDFGMDEARPVQTLALKKDDIAKLEEVGPLPPQH